MSMVFSHLCLIYLFSPPWQIPVVRSCCLSFTLLSLSIFSLWKIWDCLTKRTNTKLLLFWLYESMRADRMKCEWSTYCWVLILPSERSSLWSCWLALYSSKYSAGTYVILHTHNHMIHKLVMTFDSSDLSSTLPESNFKGVFQIKSNPQHLWLNGHRK